MQVASKLLHKELDDDQIIAMMEFAQSMASKSENSIPGVVDAEGFCRLVERFSGCPQVGWLALARIPSCMGPTYEVIHPYLTLT